MCSAIPSAPVQVVARLCLILLYSVISVFARFASQTSGLCSAFPSATVKSVTRFCYALVRTLFCVLCLTNTGLVHCYSLGSRKVCSMLVFILAYSVIFCFARFASQTPGLCSATLSAPVKFVACLCLFCFIQYTNFLLCLFCLTNIRFVQCFSLRLPSSLNPFGFFALLSLLLLCVLCPTSSGLCGDFSPAPLEFARLIFCFVLFSFNFVFCVLFRH